MGTVLAPTGLEVVRRRMLTVAKCSEAMQNPGREGLLGAAVLALVLYP